MVAMSIAKPSLLTTASRALGLRGHVEIEAVNPPLQKIIGTEWLLPVDTPWG
jgi:hypothetical protein